MADSAVSAARRIADEILFPAAAAVDAAQAVPLEMFDALAQEGLYGLDDPLELAAVAEVLAGGCLSAAFVWLQHRGALRTVAATANVVAREAFLTPMKTGRIRSGIAMGAATRPGPPSMRAREISGGWRFDGEAPWVTGWGMVDVLLLVARDEDDRLIWALVDARSSRSMHAAPQRLIAVQASGTVVLNVQDLRVPSERVLLVEPHADYLARDAGSLMVNGFLAIGVAGRAITLIGDDAAYLREHLDAARSRLQSADETDLPDARAAASELALRAASALAVHTGARSVRADSDAARLVREATFLLTFGTRPPIRAALLRRLGG